MNKERISIIHRRMIPLKRHYHITVTGLVQGVYYRAATKETADRLSIAGFVRNNPDGSVYIEAEGEEKALNGFIAWCREGPPRAVVKDVEVEEGNLINHKGFEIKR